MISAQRVVGNGSSLLLCPTTNGKVPQHRSSLRSVKVNRLKRKALRNAYRAFPRACLLYSVPIEYAPVVACAIILIQTCVERKTSVPIDYGHLIKHCYLLKVSDISENQTCQIGLSACLSTESGLHIVLRMLYVDIVFLIFHAPTTPLPK